MTAQKKQVEKSKRGRPSLYESIDKQQVKSLVLRGYTDMEIADFFHVTPQTWINYKHKYEDFFDALKDWKSEADRKVERSLFERATGYTYKTQEVLMAQKTGIPVTVEVTKTVPPDTTAMIFWLKNRNPKQWRDKTEVDHTHQLLPPPTWLDTNNEDIK